MTDAAVAVPVPAAPAVPTRLLWLSAGAVALLVAGIAADRLWALDLLHVAGGVLWTGADLLTGFLVGPIVRRLDPASRRAFMTRYMPRMLVIMPTLAVVTMTAGWQLARKVGVLETPYPRHWWVIASFVIVGVMAVTAFTILLPANVGVLLELRKERPDAELMARLMGRYAACTAVLGCMQVGTLIVMSRLATW